MVTIRLACLALSLLLAAPAASAWTLAAPPSPTGPAASGWAWTFGMARQVPMGGNPAGAVVGAAACALGDANADGVGDLLIQAKDLATGLLRLTALAGPGFQTVLWTQATSASRVLVCAPPLGVDGVASPVLRTAGQRTSAGTEAMGVADERAQLVFQAIDGATGRPLVGRAHLDTRQGASGSASVGAAGVTQFATASLLPAAGGAEAFLQTSVSQAQALAMLELPVGSLTAQLESTARLDLLDSSGRVVGSVTLDTAGEIPMALATVPLASQFPDVVALTRQAVSPAEEVAGSVPKLALYTADGTLAWSVSLAATTGVPLLVPRAGDLNLDGVPDLVVATVQAGVEGAQQGGDAIPASTFHLVSGIDGHILLSPPPINGLLTALPLGQLPTGPALLQVERLAGSATLTLSAVDGAGKVLWSAQVDAVAEPINAALDAYTGDLIGFTDLTGDMVPDIGVAVTQGGSLALKAIDGATGSVAWTAALDAPAHIVPVVLGTTQGQVTHATAGASATLLAVGTTAPVVTLVEAATGEVLWTARALPVPLGAEMRLSVEAAGDLDADGVQDLLATATAATGNEAAVSSVVALSGATGLTLFSATTDAGQLATAVNFTAEPGPAFQALADYGTGSAKAAPLPLLPLNAALLLAVALLGRRLRA